MIKDHLKMAMQSIRSRRLRSLLTMLGVIIGVAGVITSVSLGEGIKQQVINETEQLGRDVLRVRPGTPGSGGGLSDIVSILGNNSVGSLLSGDDINIIEQTEGIREAVPLTLLSGLPTKGDSSFNSAITIGTTAGLNEILINDTEFGNFLTTDDEGKYNAVIGSRVAEKLFHEFIPIGQEFRFRNKTFIVKGVLEYQKNASLSQGLDFNNVIFIPYQTAIMLNQTTTRPYEILAQVENAEALDSAAANLTERLKASRQGQQDFVVLKPSDTREGAGNLINLITVMIGIIALVSMVVGGIGIMNIMLVTVSERTREIGIRKALGATNSQIRNQFLIESAVLSVWGAIIGVFVSLVIYILVITLSNLEPVIQPSVVGFSVVLAVLIGLFFGSAPAIKAARKDPIEALRTDVF